MRQAPISAAVVALLAGVPGIAAAQAWLPPPGVGSVTVSGQDVHHTGHRLTDGTYIDNGRSRSGALLFDAEYVLTRRVALGVSLPLVWARYTDASSPPPFLPFLPRDQCRCWHTAWQDVGMTARINLVDTLDHRAAVTSTFTVVVPSHDYAYQGEAVPGRRLKEIRAGLDGSYRVDAWSPNLSVSGRYTYAMVERVIGVSTNRSNAALGVDYRLGADWSFGVSASLQRTHGGLRVGSLPPSDLPAPGELTTPERFAEHDRLLRDNWTHVGVQTSRRLGQADVFAAFTHFAAGTDTHAGHALAAGVTVPFRLRR